MYTLEFLEKQRKKSLYDLQFAKSKKNVKQDQIDNIFFKINAYTECIEAIEFYQKMKGKISE